MTTKIITSQNALDASSREGNEVNSVQILQSHFQSSFNYCFFFFNSTASHSKRHCIHWSLREKELQELNLNKKEPETSIKSTSHKLPCLVLLQYCMSLLVLPPSHLFSSLHTTSQEMQVLRGLWRCILTTNTEEHCCSYPHLTQQRGTNTCIRSRPRTVTQKHRLPGRLGKPSSKAVHTQWAHRQTQAVQDG